MPNITHSLASLFVLVFSHLCYAELNEPTKNTSLTYQESGETYKNCTSEELESIYQSQRTNLNIHCIPIFEPDMRIESRLIFEGSEFSGMSLDCKGSTLVRGIILRSALSEDTNTWHRPTQVSIKNCSVEGMIHVYGMARNGEGAMLTDSSRYQGHSLRIQSNAPTDIHFENIDSNSTGAIPFYFGPGVTYSSITNSMIAGSSNSIAIYFDAESAHNKIQGNRITTKTRTRELIAIDGSANNLISDNYFSNLSNGGIYLYRNCGEGGNIRRQPPQNNLIENNIFEYKSFWVWRPAVWLASRNGNRNYCDLDKGFNVGSSLSDLDYAQNNRVLNNQFIGRVRIKISDHPNLVEGNVSL